MRAFVTLAVVSSLLACAPKPAYDGRQAPGSPHILEVRADFDPLDADVTIVRFSLSASAVYKVLELPKRQEVWIDVEGGIPNAKTTQAGGAVEEITYTTATHSEGKGTIGRVVLRLVDPTYGLISTRGNGAGRVGEIRIGPNRETGPEDGPSRLRKPLGDGPGETE